MQTRCFPALLVICLAASLTLGGCSNGLSAFATDTSSDVRGELYQLYSEHESKAAEERTAVSESTATTTESKITETTTAIDTAESPATPESGEPIPVYITPTGKKYHYSPTCAGKNAIQVDLSEVENTYDPCKKCVHE